ncbi:MAG: serine hydrolase [Gemmatimonadaceae bacterium]
MLTATANAAFAQTCPTARDYWPTAGWKHASPSAEGMDSAMVDSAMNAFGANNDTYAAMVVRHGYVVAERHYNGGDSTTRYQLRSATKTIVSILVGLEIDQKLLHGVNQSVSSLLPEAFRADSIDPRKKKITLWHLLTMTSGLAWTEGRGADVLNYKPNWTLAILNQPMVSDPGARYNYSFGNAHVLSTIVQRVSHRTTVGFANQFLFQPIGFTLPLLEWSTDPQGVNVGGAGLNLYADEMARVGYLFLNEGCWDGKQVVSKKWVDESTKRSVSA